MEGDELPSSQRVEDHGENLFGALDGDTLKRGRPLGHKLSTVLDRTQLFRVIYINVPYIIFKS